MSCVRVEINRVGGMVAGMEMLGGSSAEMVLVRSFSASLGLVCGTSLGQYDILWSSTDALITHQNNRILVRRKHV